jgi:tetratricopeptide (TPR) repeat protein
MRRTPLLSTGFAVLSLVLVLGLAACSGNARQPDGANAQLAFGTSMAQRGLWQEALFRFREAERLEPQNFKVHNNLGVAYEAAGDYENALNQYKRALEIAPANREAKSNYARFIEFYQSFKAKPGDKKAALPAATTKQPGKTGRKPVFPPGPEGGGPRRGDPGAPGYPDPGQAPPDVPGRPGAPTPPIPPSDPNAPPPPAAQR